MNVAAGFVLSAGDNTTRTDGMAFSVTSRQQSALYCNDGTKYADIGK
jgi:hypothetical protein